MSKNAFSEYNVPTSQKIVWSDCLSQKEDHYLVFFYSETCAHCHEIMGDVLSFNDENIVPIYFLDTKASETKIPISSNIDLTIGVDRVNDLFIAGTPTIIEVENWIVKANVPGSDNCLTSLNELRLHNKS